MRDSVFETWVEARMVMDPLARLAPGHHVTQGQLEDAYGDRELPLDAAIAELVSHGLIQGIVDPKRMMRRLVLEAAERAHDWLLKNRENREQRAIIRRVRDGYLKPIEDARRNYAKAGTYLRSEEGAELLKNLEAVVAEKATKWRMAGGAVKDLTNSIQTYDLALGYKLTAMASFLRDAAPIRGRPQELTPRFILELSQVWKDTTGAKPTCSNNDSGLIGGPFYDFCCAAAETMNGPFFEISTVVGSAVQEVCNGRLRFK